MINEEYMTPFIEGTQAMLATMVGISCNTTDSSNISEDESIFGSIPLSGSADGQITLHFPIETATRIVSEMLGMDDEEMDEETLKDGVGEMANIVAGNAKAALSETEYQFQLGLPSISIGSMKTTVPESNTEPVSSCMQTDFGDFRLVIWLVPKKG